jgi:Polyketide cyclase / dehydrase and lipid transport
MPRLDAVHTGRLNAPPALVWQILTDLDSASHWLERLAGSGSGSVQPGEAWWLVGRRRVVGRLTAIEPQRRLRVVLGNASMLLRGIEIGVSLEPAEAGTSFRVGVSAVVPGLAAWMLPWFRLRAEVELHRAARGLRARVEELARDERRQPVADLVPTAAMTLPQCADLASLDFVGA